MLVYITPLLALVAIIIGIIAIVKSTSLPIVEEEVKTLLHSNVYLQTKLSNVESETRLVANQNTSLEQSVKNQTLISEVGTIHIPSIITNKGTGSRTDSIDVLFKKTYAVPPTILLSVHQLDVASPPNIRYVVSSEDVTTTGFKIKLTTWGDTILFSCKIQYTVLKNVN